MRRSYENLKRGLQSARDATGVPIATEKKTTIFGVGRQGVRDRDREVRRVRNFWAHEEDAGPMPMTVDEARARLQADLSDLPDEWG